MNSLFDQNAIAAHDRAFAAAHPDWDEIHGLRRLVDPVVCLARRESPEDGAPLCGAWLSEHCPDCGLCPGVHADDCDAPRASEIRCPRCAAVFPWHTGDCAGPRISDSPERTEK